MPNPDVVNQDDSLLIMGKKEFTLPLGVKKIQNTRTWTAPVGGLAALLVPRRGSGEQEIILFSQDQDRSALREFKIRLTKSGAVEGVLTKPLISGQSLPRDSDWQ